MKRIIALLLLVSALLMSCTGCYFEGSDDGGADTVLGNGRSVLRIVSGSENAELEPILEKFAQKENIDFMIDDSYDVCKKLSENGIRTIYFRDKEMKKLEQNEYLKEVSNWGEIYRYIKEIEVK